MEILFCCSEILSALIFRGERLRVGAEEMAII